jgi:hypothetical protein
MLPTKPKTLFDHLSGLTHEKVSWESLSDADKKSFSVYMINRWLSMNLNFIEIVNEFQQYTIGQLDPREVYKLYFDFLPKQKQFNKYIKGKKEDRHNPALVDLMSKHFLVSRDEASEYIDMLQQTSLNTIKEIIKKYGKTDKEVAALLKTTKNEKDN